MAEYDDRAVGILSQLNCRISQLERTLNASTTTPVIHQNVAATTILASSPRLPELKIDIFNGELQKWMSFWEQFEGTIHRNTAISVTDKFHYLRKYLAGDAAATIAGFPTTESSYNDAISMLQQRFGDKQRIEQQHLTALRQLRGVKSADDIRGMRKLYDTTQLNVRCLVALGVSTSTFSAMLCNILLEALPYEMALEYHRERSRNSSTSTASPLLPHLGGNSSGESSQTSSPTSSLDMEELLNFIRIELESRERIVHHISPEQK